MLCVQAIYSCFSALHDQKSESDSAASIPADACLIALCHACRRAEGAYALQLALSAAGILLASQPENGSSRNISFEAVMGCIQSCDDRLVQNAALSLLGLLAAAMPQKHLTRLAEVFSRRSYLLHHSTLCASPQS